MASGRGLVQRVRHVRRAGVQFQHYAHVLHFAGEIPGYKTSAQDQTSLFHHEIGVFQNRHRLVPVIFGIVFGHAPR